MKEQPSRRKILAGAAATGLAATLGSTSAFAANRDLIRAENQKPGTTDWILTKTRVDPATKYRCPWIEGYCSHTSIRAGEVLEVMVSTNPESKFTLDVYRMGYYGGKGARHMGSWGPIQGRVQPDPEIGIERVRECRWTPSLNILIPPDWLSGVYLGKLTEEKEKLQSYVIFIVRDDRKCDFLYQCSDTTWSAYNRWPSQFSLYDDGKKVWYWGPNVRVSFDRPYGKYCQIDDWPLSQGSGEFLLWEFPLAFWLEQEGYDVSYISNLDTHQDAAGLKRAKGWISTGHDEYWSREMFNNMKAAVKNGLNVAFLSADTCLGVIEFSGTRERAFSRVGVFGEIEPVDVQAFPEMSRFRPSGLDEGELLGNRTVQPIIGLADWVCTNDTHWLFEKTNMKNGDGIPGLVGWEWQGDPAPIPGLEVVARQKLTWNKKEAEYTATIYKGPKGNHVFSCATIWWSDGLSEPPGYKRPKSYGGKPVTLKGPDPRVQQITRNLLERFRA
ncbi:MAG TPA: N,N-dimethylformamidase beta subunit family domain-containing protein [Planctomycetota bacterium]|nr:N,N-dimethylformamidase beta subunit family domain-containing protein [Planctomycetota bacterium]